MSGETEANQSGWTVDTLRAHYDVRLKDLKEALDERYEAQAKAVEKAFENADKAVQAALTAQEKAVLKAERDANSRFESVNEFRAQLADQARTFMPRTEAVSFGERNAERTQELAALVSTLMSRAEAKAFIDSIGTKVDDLATRIDKSEGKGSGLTQGWGLLVGAVGLIVTLIVLYNLFRGIGA